MMKHAIMAVTLAATGEALADGEALRFEVSNDLTPASRTTTVRLIAEFDPRDYAFAGVSLDIVASEPNWFELHVLAPMSGSPGIPARTGERILDAQIYQFNWPLAADPTNPMPLWEASFEVFDFTPREIMIWTETESFSVYPFPGGLGGVSRPFAEASAVIHVVPGPSSLAAICAALCFACTRQRRRC